MCLVFFVDRFVIAAVSPAVVVPQLLSLQDRGYGIKKGVPTLVIAAASFDDVLAISGFGIALGLIFSSGEHFFFHFISCNCRNFRTRLNFVFFVLWLKARNFVAYKNQTRIIPGYVTPPLQYENLRRTKIREG